MNCLPKLIQSARQFVRPGIRAIAAVLLLNGIGFVGAVAAAPLISEFMADNESVLADEDGEFRDWIEIYNPDAAPIELGAYFLTDDSEDLEKWQIPAGTVLAPSAFLIIFASDKDRAVAGAELHTNFKLNDDGEYLALVDPDGMSVVSEYAPTFPVQFDDASYGVEQIGSGTEEVVVEVDAPCRVHVPESGSLGLGWTQDGFADGAWAAGSTGVGYERSSGFQDYIQTDVEAPMFNRNASVYIRIPFTVIQVGEISALALEMQYDDGFIAYLNGERVGDGNGPVSPSWNSVSTAEHKDSEAIAFEHFLLNAHIPLLQEGDNVLAIHGLNRGTYSSDLLIRPRLLATRITNPTTGGPAYFIDPSPGALNGQQEGLPASEVTISEPSKTFTSLFEVTLGGAASGQTIRYTLDGSIPDAGSPVYSAPLMIINSTQLRARSFGAGGQTGPIAMATYLRLGVDLQYFSSNLPIVILENWGGGKPGTEGNVDGFWAIIEPDSLTDHRSAMLDPLHIATRCGMRRRGSSSAGWPKYALALEAQDEDGFDEGIEPLGMPKESDWILSGRYEFDRALMRNPLIYRLSNEAGEYAVRTRFVEVFNNTGGGNLSYADDYFGVYTLMEKIKRDDQRVDVAPTSPGDTVEPEVSGGYMFKKDRLDPGDSGFSVNTMGSFAWVEPKEREVVPAQQSWLQNNLNELDAALYSSTWTNPSTGRHFTEYLDTGSWLRHHWCNTLAKNVDGFRLSGYYYKDRSDTNGGRIGAGPVWDFDRTMESTDNRDNSPTTWDGTGDSSLTWGDSRFPWWGRALTNPDFRQAHIDLWQDLHQTTFSWANIESIIDEFTAEIDYQDPSGTNPGLGRSPVARNFAKWTAVPPRGGSHAGEVIILKDWLQSRVNWIDLQFTARPAFTPAPGLVSPGTSVYFSGAGGTVYYTTDGADPRLPGGGVSPSAAIGHPVTIHASTIITARARSGTGLTSWSGPLQGTFLVGPIANAGNLIISEVHYAPLPPGTPAELAAGLDASDFEFLEVANISSSDTIDLTDVHFEAGIDFTFTGAAITSLAPGERAIIVCNQAAFEARYGTSHSSRIAGEYSPTRLDNAGERLHLVDALGGTIADFTYNDKHPWPIEAGYAGYSMILTAAALPVPDYTVATHWRLSGSIGGNPGFSESHSLVGPPTADDDQDGLVKILEHALGTSDSDPADGSSAYRAAVQAIEVEGIVQDYLTISHQRDLSADDVVITPELSIDLATWDTGEPVLVFVSEVSQGDGTSLVTYRTADPYDPAAVPHVFLRLKASAP